MQMIPNSLLDLKDAIPILTSVNESIKPCIIISALIIPNLSSKIGNMYKTANITVNVVKIFSNLVRSFIISIPCKFRFVLLMLKIPIYAQFLNNYAICRLLLLFLLQSAHMQEHDLL